MIARLLEAFFRHKLLLLLPPVLIPLLVGPIALATTPEYYETWVGIWVDRPTYLNYADNWNRYLTPAQNQSNQLSELLRTRAFLVDLVSRTSLAGLVGSPTGEERVETLVRTGLSSYTSGEHLIVMHFRAPTARVSYEVLNALIETFKDRTSTERTTQASLAISFFESRQQTAQESVSKATDDLRQYLAARSRTSRPIDPGLAGAASDPQLAGLQHQLQLAQADLDNVRSALVQAQYDASAAVEGQDLGFQVVDPPKQPTAPTRAIRQRLIFPAAGLIVGLGLTGILLVILVAADRSIRTPSDLVPPVRVIGMIPRLTAARSQRRGQPDSTRRGIGFAAGTALPAPSRGK